MLSDQMDSFVWPSEFACTIVTENLILPNIYNVSVGLEPTTSNTDDINLGFKKLKYFINYCLQNSILVHQETDIAKSLVNLNNNLVFLPTDPYDYLIGSILYRKFSTIAEKCFDIVFLGIDSSVGDRVQYTITGNNEIDVDLNGNFWWNEDSVNTGRNNHPSWEELNLKESPKFSPIVIKGGRSEN
jgi:hypothetical protein